MHALCHDHRMILLSARGSVDLSATKDESPEALAIRKAWRMLRKLYNWTLQKAGSPAAEVWLAIIAFIESSIFLIPADVLFVPMAIAKPARAYRFALIATVASTLGGIAGYFLGHYAYEGIAKPVLALYGKLDTFEQFRSSASKDAILLMLVTSGLAHLPPIKVVTILSGAAGINLWLFIISCIVARGARFFALAWAFARYGEAIRDFIERRLGVLAGTAAGLVLTLYFAARYAF
jgi:membrane protein YqaA with SNARE-associated domain